MQRRTFVGVATAGLAVVAAPFLYRYLTPVTIEAGWSNPSSLSLICEPDTIRTLGEKYRLLHEEESSRRSLAAQLSTLPADEPSREEMIKADFREGRTVMVDGWILSITEARQCAFASLQNA